MRVEKAARAYNNTIQRDTSRELISRHTSNIKKIVHRFVDVRFLMFEFDFLMFNLLRSIVVDVRLFDVWFLKHQKIEHRNN